MPDSKTFFGQSFFIPSPEYKEKDIPSLVGKVMIVTGGNSGIGLQTVKVLLSKGAKVYIASRNEDRVLKAIEELKIALNSQNLDVCFLKLDLGDVKQCRRAAAEFERLEDRLDTLFNNAGVGVPKPEAVTADGIEIQLGTNILGTFTFTTALLPLLLRSTRTGAFPRVVTTASSFHMSAPKDGFNFNDKNLGAKGQTDQYNLSKLGNIQFSNEFSRRYSEKGIFSGSLNPGNIRTNLMKNLPAPAKMMLDLFLLKPVELGALTQLYVGTSPSITLSESGSYFIPWARKGLTNHPKAGDSDQAERLWEWCEANVLEITGEPAVTV